MTRCDGDYRVNYSGFCVNYLWELLPNALFFFLPREEESDGDERGFREANYKPPPPPVAPPGDANNSLSRNQRNVVSTPALYVYIALPPLRSTATGLPSQVTSYISETFAILPASPLPSPSDRLTWSRLEPRPQTASPCRQVCERDLDWLEARRAGKKEI